MLDVMRLGDDSEFEDNLENARAVYWLVCGKRQRIFNEQSRRTIGTQIEAIASDHSTEISRLYDMHLVRKQYHES